MAYNNPLGSINGNSFANESWSVGKGQRVWREIRHRYPAGGKITNLNDFVDATDANIAKVPAGTPCTFDAEAKTITLLKTVGEGAKVDGLTQDEIVCLKTATATATVVYAGEVYAYMYDASVLANLKAAVPAEIHFVN